MGWKQSNFALLLVLMLAKACPVAAESLSRHSRFAIYAAVLVLGAFAVVLLILFCTDRFSCVNNIAMSELSPIENVSSAGMVLGNEDPAFSA